MKLKALHSNPDMINGNPVKAILLFAIPLFLGNIFQQIYNIVDTMVAGYTLGDSAIAAIGATSTLYIFLINFAFGMNGGFGIILSRSYGAGSSNDVKKTIASMLLLDIIIVFLLTVFASLFICPILRATNVPGSIFEEAYSYIIVIITGLFASNLYNLGSGILRALGNSRIPLLFLILSSILNLGLDIVFVVYLHWGVKGTAAATVFAQGISGLLCAFYIWKHYRDLLPNASDFVLDLSFIRELLSTGFAMAFMYCIVDVGSILYQRSINQMGDAIIVAHTAARKTISIFMMPLTSLASAYSTFVSQNWGAKAYHRIKTTLAKVLSLEFILSIVFCILIFLFGKTAVQLLTNTQNEEIISLAYYSMRLHFLFFPALGTLFVLRTTMQSLGEKVIPIASSGFELLGKAIAGLLLIPAFGFQAVCLTEPIIWTVCALILTFAFLIKKPLSDRMTQHCSGDSRCDVVKA